MPVYTRALKIEKNRITDTSRSNLYGQGPYIHYDVSELRDFSSYRARKPSLEFELECFCRAASYRLCRKWVKDVLKEGDVYHFFSYDLTEGQTLLLMGEVPVKLIKIIHSINGVINVGVAPLDTTGLPPGVMLSRPYLPVPLCFFKPNHDHKEGEEWLGLLKGTQSEPKKDCLECKGSGKVVLFQHTYACSLCGDGKRL